MPSLAYFLIPEYSFRNVSLRVSIKSSPIFFDSRAELSNSQPSSPRILLAPIGTINAALYFIVITSLRNIDRKIFNIRFLLPPPDGVSPEFPVAPWRDSSRHQRDDLGRSHFFISFVRRLVCDPDIPDLVCVETRFPGFLYDLLGSRLSGERVSERGDGAGQVFLVSLLPLYAFQPFADQVCPSTHLHAQPSTGQFSRLSDWLASLELTCQRYLDHVLATPNRLKHRRQSPGFPRDDTGKNNGFADSCAHPDRPHYCYPLT